MKEKIWISLILLVFMTVSVQAQWTIKGQLVDTSLGEDIAYATVHLYESGDTRKVVLRTTSDQKGFFQAKMAKPGKFTLFLTCLGKKEIKKEILLDEKQNSVIDLGKIPMENSSVNLEEFTVVAHIPLVKVDIDKLVYNVKADPESQTSSTLEILRKVPMIDVDGEDKIQVQGSSNFKVYVNGKLSNMISNNPTQVLRSMPANTVRGVEVITEPGAKYDAEGTGGVINIIMDRQLIDGYTGAVGAGVDNLGGFGGNAYFSFKRNKIVFAGNYSYDQEKKPYSDFYLNRADYTTTPTSIFSQTGKEKKKEVGQILDFDLSYEIDSLNLFSFAFNNFFGKDQHYSESFSSENWKDGDLRYAYSRNSEEDNSFRNSTISTDYQYSPRNQDERFTLSYRLDLFPDNSDTYTEVSDSINFRDYLQHVRDNISSNEQTVQLDYLNAISKKHTIEAGVKGIFRYNKSEIQYNQRDYDHEKWENIPGLSENYKHHQDIYALYGNYRLALEKWGVSAGTRIENTAQKASFFTRDTLFNSNETNVIPSVKVAYQFDDYKTARLGYHMRLYRPGINYLNPYIDNTDPANVYFGNPNLKTEKNHNFSFNFSSFTKKTDLDVNLNYSFTDNSIERYSFIKDGTTHTTYGNIGKNQNASLNIYFNCNPTRKLRVYLNERVSYTDISTTKGSGTGSLNASGFSNRLSAGFSYRLPKDFTVSAYAGYSDPKIRLQSTGSLLYYTRISLRKYLLEKKLSISLSATNPFPSRTNLSSTTKSDDFWQDQTSYRRNQIFSLKITYRFGKLNHDIKKAERSISNDDIKAEEEDDETSEGQ